MPVVIDEMTTVPAAAPAAGGGESAAGGGEESQPSEHEIERLPELQASRAERIRAY
jgi:hypothetical protein